MSIIRPRSEKPLNHNASKCLNIEDYRLYSCPRLCPQEQPCLHDHVFQNLIPQLAQKDFCLCVFPCHAFHCPEAASKSSSFSRPFKPCHCSSLDRAAFARTASRNNSDTLTRALLHPRFHFIQTLIKRMLWQTFRPLGFFKHCRN